MCKLFDKIFQLPFKKWLAKEDKKQLELVVPINNEDMKKLMNEIANKLNDEVEIIEEDKTIEELKEIQENDYMLRYPNNKELMNKINELIKEINKMKEDK